MKLNQKGSSPLVVVLILVVVAVLAGSGWYVWHKNQTKPTAKKSTTTNTPADKAQDKTATAESASDLLEKDANGLADAIFAKCDSTSTDLRTAIFTDIKAKMEKGNVTNTTGTTYVRSGSYVKTASFCSITEGGSGFEGIFKKESSGTWTVITTGTMAPGCSEVDGKGIPKEVQQYCYPDTGDARDIQN